ncbi:MAG: hypothetical protein QXV18_04475 [Candidatus Nitrosocaldus sp.]
MSSKVRCLECEADLKVPSDAIEGEILTCPDCRESYELEKQGEGFNIKPAQVVGEDWGQ